MGFCLFPKQKLLDWLCCSSPVWLAGLHHQLPIFIFGAIFVLSSLALSRCYLAKAATLRSFMCFSTACLLVFWLLLGVVLSLQEVLDNCGLFLPIRMDYFFSPRLSWASSCPSLLPDSWRVRPWAGSLASIPVCSGANAVGARSSPGRGSWACLQYRRDFQNGFLPNLLLFLFCVAGSIPSSLTRAAVFNVLLLSCLHIFNSTLDFEAGCPAFSTPPQLWVTWWLHVWSGSEVLQASGEGEACWRGQIGTWLT